MLKDVAYKGAGNRQIDSVPSGPGPLNIEYTGAGSFDITGSLSIAGVAGSQVIRVDANGAGEHVRVTDAVAYAAANPPPSTDDQLTWFGKDGWVISVAPGVYPDEEPFTVPAFTTVTGPSAVATEARAADAVLIFRGALASSGDMITLEQNADLLNLQIGYFGANSGLGGSLTGPVSIIAVDTAEASTNNVVENVLVEVGFVGAGNDAHPVVLVDHRVVSNSAFFRLKNCRFNAQHVGLPAANAGTRLVKVAGVTGLVQGVTVDDCIFLSNSGLGGAASLSVGVEVTSSRVIVMDSSFLGFATGTAFRQNGAASITSFRRTTYDGGIVVNDGGTIGDGSLNPPATSAAAPGVPGEVRYSATHVQRHQNGQWEQAPLAYAAVP